MFVGRSYEKKLCYRPWVVALITMAATPADLAEAGDGGCAASSTRTTTAEVSAGHRSDRSPRSL